jgi:Fic family protein
MEISKYKSGNWQQQYQYKSFNPSLINHEWEVDDGVLNKILSEANIRLGELNAFSELIPDVDFFIRMHVEKEATTSSRIEGTRTNIEDAIQKEENIEPDKRQEWNEVRNYVMAMNMAVEKLKTFPLSNRLLRESHEILMQGVRGENKTPGSFRTSQNWIGGASISDAVFIPPHHDLVPELMGDLENFLHNQSLTVPDLIKIGIAHYQFETIHPFLDGNGRIGRLLITLYLVDKSMLTKPTLYLSDFLEKHKSLYYDNLMRVRTHHDLKQWLKFFLEGVKQTAESSILTFKKIIALRRRLESETLPQLGRKSKSAQQLLMLLYTRPILDSSEVTSNLKISPSAALRLIEDFVRHGILKEITGYKRNRIFAFSEYIELFR